MGPFYQALHKEGVMVNGVLRTADRSTLFSLFNSWLASSGAERRQWATEGFDSSWYTAEPS